MAKMKTHKASSKRFSVTKSGKVKMSHANHRHNLGLKTQKRKRHLRTGAYLSEAMCPAVRTLIQKD
jgi:large subunit ribosomal protein L35